MTALICTLATLALLLTGCSAGKKAQKTETPETVPTEIALQTPVQRYDALCAGYTDWQDVSMPLKVTLTSPKKPGFSARAVMRHNEWITMSIRMLGFEVASLWIDRDSIHAVDRYHKLYLSESVSRALAGTDITIGNIQDLLLGRGCVAGTTGGTFTDALVGSLTLTPGADGLIIVPAAQNGRFEYGYILYPDANNIMAASVTVGDSHSAVMTYTGFTDTDAGRFARHADINIIKGKNISAELEWDLRSAKWNTGAHKEWKQPEGYTRIPADKLLKSLTSL